MFFVSSRYTLDLWNLAPCLKVIDVSQLAKVLNRLLDEQNLTQAELVRKTESQGNLVTKGTVSKYFSDPPARPQRRVLRAFAEALGVPLSDLEDAATFTGLEPFVPDPSADRLTEPQRAVLNDLIRVMANSSTREGEGNASPAHRQAEGSSAQGDGLGAFGHRDRGDLDHESKNEGAGDNVHELFTDPPAEDESAAYRTRNRDKEAQSRQDADAEHPDD